MTVSELRQHLEHFPQDAEVRGFYDSGDRLRINAIWESSEGVVVLGEHPDGGLGPGCGRPFWSLNDYWKTPTLEESLKHQHERHLNP